MTEEQFRTQAAAMGYQDFQVKSYEPGPNGPLHTHAFAVMLLVLEGEFGLDLDDGAVAYRPGELCELAAHVRHTERAGPSGARVLLAKRG